MCYLRLELWQATRRLTKAQKHTHTCIWTRVRRFVSRVGLRLFKTKWTQWAHNRHRINEKKWATVGKSESQIRTRTKEWSREKHQRRRGRVSISGKLSKREWKAETWEEDVMTLTLTSAFLLSKVLAAAMTNKGRNNQSEAEMNRNS